jgi:Mpv17 / PMP22 family
MSFLDRTCSVVLCSAKQGVLYTIQEVVCAVYLWWHCFIAPSVQTTPATLLPNGPPPPSKKNTTTTTTTTATTTILTMNWFSRFGITALCAICSVSSLLGPARYASLRSGGANAAKTGKLLSLSVLGHIGNAIRSKPILRDSLACMCLSGIGDVLAQRFELFQHRTDAKQMTASGKPMSDYELLDFRRASSLASFGLLIAGPLYSHWFPFLDGLCSSWPLAKYGVWAAPTLKMLLEMTFLEPVILSVFFGYMNVAEGGTLETYKHKMREEFVLTYTASLAVWPPVMVLSFRFIPVAAQTVCMSLAEIFFDAFLSYRNAKNHVSSILTSGREEEHRVPVLKDEFVGTETTSMRTSLLRGVASSPKSTTLKKAMFRLNQPTGTLEPLSETSIEPEGEEWSADEKDDNIDTGKERWSEEDASGDAETEREV